MKERIRVLLLIPHPGGGGAERVFALLAGGLSREKYDLHLAYVTACDASRYASQPGVTVHWLGARRVRRSAFRVLRLVRRLKPDVILSGMFHLNFLVLLLRPLFPRATRVLVRQNGTVSAALAQDKLPFYTRTLYRLLYRRADCVICQTESMAKDLARELKMGTGRIAVAPNPVDLDVAGTDAAVNSTKWSSVGPRLLAVGRLAREKGFDLLLEAFGQVSESFPTAELVIVGVGAEEAALKTLRNSMGLEVAVHFPGHVERPADYFPGTSVFVLSSRHEGMPNAMLEAAAAGLPLVALPALGGLTDLLSGQPGTWMAQEISAPALADSLLEALRELKPGERFTHSFLEPFRMERAVRRYEELIDAAVEEQQS